MSDRPRRRGPARRSADRIEMRPNWSLPRIRRLARTGWGRAVAVVVALHYSVLSMWASGMLVVAPTGQPWSVYWVTAGGAPDWWDYPALVVLGPSVIIAFPPALTFVMVAAAGLLGLTVAASMNLLWKGAESPRVPRRDPASVARLDLRGPAVAPFAVALVGLGTGCGADFTVAGLALFGGVAAVTRGALVTLSLALGLLDLCLMLVSLRLLEEALARSGTSLSAQSSPQQRASLVP